MANLSFQCKFQRTISPEQSLYITLQLLINIRTFTAELGGGYNVLQLHRLNLGPGHTSCQSSPQPIDFLTINLSLVREQAGKRLPQVSNGLGLGFVFVAGTEGLTKGIEGIGERLGFTEKQTQTTGKMKGLDKVLSNRIIMCNLTNYILYIVYI